MTSKAEAERVYRALLNAVRDSDVTTQGELLVVVTGDEVLPWEELSDGVKSFTRSLAKALAER